MNSESNAPAVALGGVAWPGVSDIIARVFAYGISPEHVKD